MVSKIIFVYAAQRNLWVITLGVKYTRSKKACTFEQYDQSFLHHLIYKLYRRTSDCADALANHGLRIRKGHYSIFYVRYHVFEPMLSIYTSGEAKRNYFCAHSGKILTTMPRNAFKIGATFKREVAPREQILSFNSSLYGKHHENIAI